MRSILLAAATAIVAASPITAQSNANQQRIPELPVLPRDEEAALAATGAPRSLTDHATILVRTEKGLEEHRAGTNGYVCLVERFGVDNVSWPTCYDPDAARFFVAKNRLLEEMRVQGKTLGEFNTALAEAIAKGTIAVPGGGGLSYRLSPEAYVKNRSGEVQPGIWMLMVSAPYATMASIGITDPKQLEGVVPTFGVQSPGRPEAYLWFRVQTLPGTPAASAGQR